MENSKYSLNGLEEILTWCPVFGSYLILLITSGSNFVNIWKSKNLRFQFFENLRIKETARFQAFQILEVKVPYQVGHVLAIK
jgi:hypothetical protein